MNKLDFMEEKKPPSFADYVAVLLKRRLFIIKTFTIVTFTALIISLTISPQYTATATILPPNPQQDMMFGLLQSSVLSNIGGLSSLGGILQGAATPSDLFVAILESGTIMGEIVRKFNLKKVFKTRTMDDTYKMLQSITKFGVTPEGIVSVTVTWYDKNLAAAIANSFIEELDKFNTETAMTVGKKYRIFIEKRLQENIDTLAQVEEGLRQFQEKHRTIALEVEIENAIKAVAELKSHIILLEVQKGAIASASQFDNPYLYEINKQLSELKKQLSKIEFGDTLNQVKEYGAGFGVPFSNLPAISLEYARLFRDVTVQSTIYELLTQQYEQAKIMELKDTPTVQVLDKASPPEKKSTPKRAQIVLLSAFFSIILGIVVSFFLESFEQLKKNPEEFRKWLDITNKLKNDLINVKTKLTFFLKTPLKR